MSPQGLAEVRGHHYTVAHKGRVIQAVDLSRITDIFALSEFKIGTTVYLLDGEVPILALDVDLSNRSVRMAVGAVIRRLRPGASYSDRRAARFLGL